MQDPLERVSEFFQKNNDSYSAPKYPLEQSPVAPLIGSGPSGSAVMYYCKLHPKFKNIHWDVVEHSIRYGSEVMEHLEFLANFYRDRSQ